MKQIVISAMLVVAMLFAIKAKCYTMCDPCPGTNWQSAQNLILADIFGCVFLVDFDYKTCPNGTRIIKITRIEFVDPNQCNGVMIEQIMNQSIRGVLRYASSTFQIQNPSIPFEISVITPTCWVMQYSVMYECQTDSCCSTKYTLRYYNENYELTEEPDTYTPNDICSTSVGGIQCIKMCDAHYIPPYEPIFRRTYEPFCNTNCNEPWERLATNFVTTSLSPNCIIKAYYDIRYCNNIIQFSIYKIEYDDDCSTETAILQKAVKAVLNRIYQMTSRMEIIAVHQSCWKKIEGTYKDFLIQCQLWEDCCIYRYILQRNPLRIDLISGYISDPNVECNYPCPNRCSVFDSMRGHSLRKIGFYELLSNNYGTVITFTPNPAEDIINISLGSEQSGEVQIKIYNSIGELVESVIIPIQSGSKIYELKTNSYINGIYYYQAEFPGAEILRGNFLIIK